MIWKRAGDGRVVIDATSVFLIFAVLSFFGGFVLAYVIQAQRAGRRVAVRRSSTQSLRLSLALILALLIAMQMIQPLVPGIGPAAEPLGSDEELTRRPSTSKPKRIAPADRPPRTEGPGAFAPSGNGESTEGDYATGQSQPQNQPASQPTAIPAAPAAAEPAPAAEPTRAAPPWSPPATHAPRLGPQEAVNPKVYYEGVRLSRSLSSPQAVTAEFQIVTIERQRVTVRTPDSDAFNKNIGAVILLPNDHRRIVCYQAPDDNIPGDWEQINDTGKRRFRRIMTLRMICDQTKFDRATLRIPLRFVDLNRYYAFETKVVVGSAQAN
jgi:hypothetical protein